MFLAQLQANFQKKQLSSGGSFFKLNLCLFLQRRWNFTRWFLLCHILATCVPQSENRSEWSACVEWNMYVQLRSIQHVCQDNACNHAHPPQSVRDTNSTSTYCCVAWNMYAQLRSIQHVCQDNACNHAHPTPHRIRAWCEQYGHIQLRSMKHVCAVA